MISLIHFSHLIKIIHRISRQIIQSIIKKNQIKVISLIIVIPDFASIQTANPSTIVVGNLCVPDVYNYFSLLYTCNYSEYNNYSRSFVKSDSITYAGEVCDRPK